MTRYVAFLRAINVGGRVVKMSELRRHFGPLALANVETFIASGNVVFDCSTRSTAKLEQTIEAHLHKALKYPVPTFLRSVPELSTLLEHPLLSESKASGPGLYVMFLRNKLSPESARKLTALNNDSEQFHGVGRDLLWVLPGGFSNSKVSGAVLEKAVGMPGTVRSSTTVRRLVDKYSS